MSSAPSFFAELRRRNVIRMAGLYVVGAWLIVQVTETVLPAFDIPSWVLRAIIILLAIGVVPTLVFSWIYELTPEGLKRDAEVTPEQSIAPQTARRMDQLTLAGVLILLTVIAADRYWPRHAEQVASSPASPSSETGSPAPARVQKSIAVLPFENLSEAKANAHFAIGVQDEILTSLARIADLKVISRTSTSRYASRPDSVAEIAAQLGVAHILEGSVQRSGDRVRVIVQLIEASTDNHLWAETYDRTLDDVFAVQSEVAQKIAESLRARLTREELAAITDKPTENRAAYEAYLQARSLGLGASYDRAQGEQVIRLLQKAAELDPRFTLAYTDLVHQHAWFYWNALDGSAKRLDMARQALERATALDPDSPEVQLARATILYYGERDFSAAWTELESVRQRIPGQQGVWSMSALVLRRLGRFEEAVVDFRRALELSPNDVGTLTEMASTLMVLGRFEQARQAYQAGLRILPNDPSLLSGRVEAEFNLGGNPAVAQLLHTMSADVPMMEGLRAGHALLTGDTVRAASLFRRALERDDGAQTSASFAAYLPVSVEWRLKLAWCLSHSDEAEQAEATYRDVTEQADAALALNSPNRNVEVAWRLARAWAQAGLGLHDASMLEAERAAALVPVAEDPFEGPAWQEYLAQIYALNGEAAKSVAVLEQFVEGTNNALTPMLLTSSPLWERIRGDAEFEDFMQRYRASKTREPEGAGP